MGAFSRFERSLEIFRFGTELPAPPAGASGCAPLPVRCVLAVADLTPEGDNAAWRAALVARDRGVPLHLLCVQPDARGLASAQSVLQDLARQLQQRLHVATTASCRVGSLREHLVRCSGNAGLLVLPWQRGKLLADALLGRPAERMFRALTIPMLVVRQPAFTSYRRVMVPVKLDAHAAAMIAAARSVSRDPRMRVFHVLDPWPEGSLRVGGLSERALRLQRAGRSRAAYAALDALIARAGALDDGACALVSFGPVPARVLEVASNAQLIVVGKQRRSLFSEIVFPDVAQHLLLNGKADTLMLPVARDAHAVREGFPSPWSAA